MYRSLPRYTPSELDRLQLPILGALLGNDMVEPSPDDVAAADELINRRAVKAREAIRDLQRQGLYPALPGDRDD